MSVFTIVNKYVISYLLRVKIKYLNKIRKGTNNSNYLISFGDHYYILTIFENISKNRFLMYKEILKYLFFNCFPVSYFFHRGIFYKKKNISISRFIIGNNIVVPSSFNCFIIGKILFRLHNFSCNFYLHYCNISLCFREFLYFLYFIKFRVNVIKYYLIKLLYNLFLCGILVSKRYSNSFTCYCHCDLFKDNTLFFKDTLSGLIDFYSSGYDKFFCDLSITINDWCFINNRFNFLVFKYLLLGYSISINILSYYLKLYILFLWINRILKKITIQKNNNINILNPLYLENKVIFYNNNHKIFIRYFRYIVYEFIN